MKKSTTIPVFLFAAVFSVIAMQTGNEISVTYTQMKTFRSVRADLSTDSIRYCLNLREDRDGLFTFQAPPFLVVNIGRRIRIGEIKDNGLFTLMISPMDRTAQASGFRFATDFKSISKPSVNPVLSGFAFSFEHADFIALSPVLNPDSPIGFGLIAGNDKVFAGFLVASQTEQRIAGAAESLQVNWKQLGIGRHMIFSLVGAHAAADSGPFRIEGGIFLQNAWDMMLGGGTTAGWNVGLKSDILTFSASGKTGGRGVKLKNLSDDGKPEKSFDAAILVKASDCPMQAGLSYRSDTYGIPVYGGSSQRRIIDCTTEVSYGSCSLKRTDETEFETDRGKNSKSTYVLEAQAYGASLKTEFTVNRPIGAPCYITKARLTFKAEHAELEIESFKARLELNWEYVKDDFSMRFSLNQDRLLTATLRFPNL